MDNGLLTNLGLFGAGLALLTVGAELLVRGSARLAIIFGVPPIVVGLTIVAFGTSAPELVVSAQAAWNNQADVAIGNAIGSNIFNIGVILGITALISPIVCHEAFARREVPIMIAVTILLPILALAGLATHGKQGPGQWLTIESWVGIAMLALLGLYTFVTYYRERMKKPEELSGELADAVAAEATPHGIGHLLLQVGFVIAGLALLVVGAQWTVDSALVMARALGVPELVISLTLVAAGTSLPELATSLVAAIRRHSEIAVGNIVGSNIFNILGVLGVASTIRPLPVADMVLYRDLPTALLFAVILLPMMLTGGKLSRLEGGILLVLYVGYAVVLAMAP